MMGPHPGSDINKSNPQWLRSHPFRTRGLPGEGALRKPDIVISRGILLFKTRADGGEGSKTPIFAGRPRWMAPKYNKQSKWKDGQGLTNSIFFLQFACP